MWLLQQAKQDPEAAKKAFACIPDYVIRDMTAWLSFVIQNGQADLVASCRLDLLIAFLTEMLQRGELVQSPIVHAKIVELLLMMLSPQLGRGRRRGELLTQNSAQLGHDLEYTRISTRQINVRLMHARAWVAAHMCTFLSSPLTS